MTNNKKPLLWEEGMSFEDYKIRQAFYNGTAQPRHSPLSQPPEDQEILDIMSYESFEDYDDFISHGFIDCWRGYRYEWDVTDYNWCSDQLFQYSLFGLESIDIYD